MRSKTLTLPKAIGVLAAIILTTGGIASAYEVVPVPNGATITGRATFVGEPREPKIFKIEKNPEVCGAEDRVLYEVSVQDGNLADVVFVLKDVEKGKPYGSFGISGPGPGSRELIAGEGSEFPGTAIRPKTCLFGAFTGVIADGTSLKFDNQDNVKHSPHTYLVKGRVRQSLHNKDLEGESKLELTVKFDKDTTNVLKLECDQHNHMQNWFYRVRNPYYGFSAEDGTFSIGQVPPGTYTLVGWHPILGEQEQEVIVEANGTIEVSFEFKVQTRRRGRSR